MRSIKGVLFAVFLLVLCRAGMAADYTLPWDIKELSIIPTVYPDPAHNSNEVKAIFYQGLPWRGKPTRVFAYHGIPAVTNGQKVPAMVLVHGGGGSAYLPWVKLWMSRGYAAIAMDTCGSISSGGFQSHPRHEAGGPPGWGGLDQIDESIADQWTYHAVADVILAHSLIRSFSEVDPERTGITGISWGGYLTCIAASVDSRFKFAAPVYGCGFLGENSVWLDEFKRMGSEKSAKWLSQWDPAKYLGRAKMPFLWVNGTCDFAYPMDSWQKSYRLPKTPRTLCLRVNMPHGHGGAGENPEEIRAMADAAFGRGLPLTQVVDAGSSDHVAWVSYKGKGQVVRAELSYTSDSGAWQKRVWHTERADLDVERKHASVSIPANATVYYFNLVDEHNLVVSSEHVVVER